MNNEKKKALLKALGIFAALFIILAFFLFFVFEFYITPQAEKDKYDYYSVMSKNTNDIIMVEGSHVLTQTFTAKDSIGGFDLFVGFTEEKLEERAKQSVNGEWVRVKGDVTISLIDENGSVLDCYEMDEDQWNEALFFGRIMRYYNSPIVGDVRGHTYTLKVETNLAKDAGIFFYISDADFYQEGEMTVDGASYDRDLGFFISSPNYTMLCLIFLAFSAVILLLFTVSYWCIYFFHAKPHIIFLIVVLLLGTVYTVLMTPYTVPDEKAHFYTAYRVSNILLGTEATDTPDKSVAVRACDTDYNGIIYDWRGRSREPAVSTYAAAINAALGAKENKDDFVILQSNAISGNYVCYIPAGIGIAIGRALGASSVVTFYLGRFMNLLLFAILGMLAMRKMPFSRNILFPVALMPMAMQQVASYSYDSVIFAFAVYFVAACLDLAYQRNRVRIWDWIALVLCAVVFCAPKSGIYVLLLGVGLIILFNTSIPSRQRWLTAASIAAIGIFLLLAFNLHRVGEHVGGETEITYTLDWLLENPREFVNLWGKTYFVEKEKIVYSLFGSDMAWHTKVERTFALPMCLFMVLASLRSPKMQEKSMRKTDNIFILLVVLAVIAGFCAAAFLWTQTEYDYIWGIQTRYVLPILPLILLLFRNAPIACKKDITSFLINGLVLINGLYIVDALNVFLNASV